MSKKFCKKFKLFNTRIHRNLSKLSIGMDIKLNCVSLQLYLITYQIYIENMQFINKYTYYAKHKKF